MKRTLSILSLAFILTFTALGQMQMPMAMKTGPENLSKQQLLSLIATAKTPAEHQRIAQYYEAQAQKYLALSKEHAAMAEQYKKNPLMGANKHFTSTLGYCESLVGSFQKLSVKMQQLAEVHLQMAKEAAQK
jgi:hypothetical protein